MVLSRHTVWMTIENKHVKLILFSNTTGFSKQVKQKVTERRLAVGGLEEEVEYRFSVRAVSAGAGAGAAGGARARTGPQAGSPAAPRALQLAPEPAALRLRWDNAASGQGPLLGYYFEARRKGMFVPSDFSPSRTARPPYFTPILSSGLDVYNRITVFLLWIIIQRDDGSRPLQSTSNFKKIYSLQSAMYDRLWLIYFNLQFRDRRVHTCFVFNAAKESWQACKFARHCVHFVASTAQSH